VVLGFAVWNLRLVVPLWLDFTLWSLVMCLTATVLGAFRPAESMPGGYAKALGLLALALGVLLGLRAVESGLGISLLQGPLRNAAQAANPGWAEQDLEGALAQARASGRPVLVDTYADWCAQCKELDESTWSDPQVAGWIQANAVPVRIDTFKLRKDLAPKLGILSYPTVILLEPDGRERRRILGFQKPAEMLRFLKG